MTETGDTGFALRITQASLNQTALDWPQNMANHYAAIDAAVADGADIMVTHELSIHGYEVNDNFQRVDNNRTYEALADLAAYAYAKDPNLMVSVGCAWRLQLRDVFAHAAAAPDLIKNPLYDRLSLPFNTQVLLAGGRVIGFTAKANLYRDERGYENRYFNEWSFRDAKQIAELSGIDSIYGTIPVTLPDGQSVPFGRPLTFVTDDQGHSFVYAQAICEEKWAAAQYDGAPHNDSRYEQLNIIPSISRYLGSRNGLFLEIANASPPSALKQDKHIHLNDLASEYADIVVDTDGLGTSGATFAQFGHRLISQDGQTISAAPRNSFRNVATTASTVRIHTADESLSNKTHSWLARDFKNPDAVSDTKLAWDSSVSAWENPGNPDRWKEEHIRNLALWMFDYMRKTGARGIMQALSGGKDSSFNSTMVRVMVELAMHELGVEGFCEYMPHLSYNKDILDAYAKGGRKAAVETCMSHMLTCVYMGTKNSSFETWYAAKTLVEGDGAVKGIGGKFIERNVQDLLNFNAFAFALKDPGSVPREQKLEMMDELAEFLNASPYDHTPEDMKAWQERLFEKYPQIDNLLSAAIPANSMAYENLQARAREVLIWVFANLENKLPIANPNLDEGYGAYTTFAGDLHSGTIGPNAGIHKADQEAMMQYLEDHGIPGVMDRVLALAPANKNRPTAELLPKKDGKVTQFDEIALQASFPQKALLSRLRHHIKIDTKDGARWMNAGELFKAARNDRLFDNMNDNMLFNSVAYFYERWEGPAQHKIHASPISPTFGENIDKQTSLRTPNLGGGSHDEIAQLGINLMFGWARADGLNWSEASYRVLQARAWQDKAFVKSFNKAIRNRDPNLANTSFNLRALYDEVKEQGWDKRFGTLRANHPIAAINRYRA